MTRKPELCDHCCTQLGQARIVVHDPDPNRPSGTFHNDVGRNCYHLAVAASQGDPAVVLVRRVHGDLETVCGGR